MNRKGVRHNRILELRGMALRGAKLSQLMAKCVGWQISRGTMDDYIREVRESLQRIVNKNV